MYGLIYMHTCILTGKSYIGQTTKSMEVRWKEHLLDKHKTKFHRALKKYNEKYWTHKVLAYASDKEALDNLETFYIEKYKTVELGYNLKTGGSHGLHSKESKELMSEKRKGIGRPHTEESKIKISRALKGRRLDKTHKENLSKAKKGKQWTVKQREVHAGKFLGKNNPNFGKKTSKETINKMRIKMGKRVLCVETGKIFSCAGEAAEFLGVKRCGIQRCLNKGGMSHGFHWVYQL